MPGGWHAGVEIVFEIGKAFKLPEVAETLGISLRQVQGHVTDGTLVAVNVGRGIVRRDLRVMEEAIEDFARSRKVAPRGIPPRLSARAPRRIAVRNRNGGI
ncbi:helix-turn-helix domain-containing protein [Methylobacterium sp. WL69]|nr:helix-turn-helix domain-containing protein [Methylobacterium sp. WL69]TXM79411.1 helix-turn-helix domain-containing protein [Methylobacterium sp. WL69]